MPTYEEYIASAAWKALRQRRLEIDGFECRACGRTEDEIQLDVHHKRYDKNFGGREDVEKDLTTFCVECHEVITSFLRKRRYASRVIKVDILANGGANGTRGLGNVAREDIQIDIIKAADHAQWFDGQSVKQVVAFDQGDFIKEKKDRRRS